jgi:hypothetical protein
VFPLPPLIFSSMNLFKDFYYNILVTRYDEDSKPCESRWMVFHDSLSLWLSQLDLHISEVTIRDIEVINFDTAVFPRWFKFGD